MSVDYTSQRLQVFMAGLVQDLKNYAYTIATETINSDQYTIPVTEYSIGRKEREVFKCLAPQHLTTVLDTLGIATNAERSEITWHNDTVKADELRVDDRANKEADLVTIRQHITNAIDKPGLFVNLTIELGSVVTRCPKILMDDIATTLRNEYPEFHFHVEALGYNPQMWSRLFIFGKKDGVDLDTIYDLLMSEDYTSTDKSLIARYLATNPEEAKQVFSRFKRVYDGNGNLVKTNQVSNNDSVVWSEGDRELDIYRDSTEEILSDELIEFAATINKQLIDKYEEALLQYPYNLSYQLSFDIPQSLSKLSAIQRKLLADKLELQPVKVTVQGSIVGWKLVVTYFPLGK